MSKPRCPSLQDGCDRPDKCNAEGMCSYTGLPFIGSSAIPFARPDIGSGIVCGRQTGCRDADLCKMQNKCLERVHHPLHYGGGNNPYEVIKVIYAWGLDKSFNLGNAVKYIARHKHKDNALEDLKKARWYLDEEIKQRERA